MPIVFEELEQILVQWNIQLDIKKPINGFTANWVYNNMKDKIDKQNIKKIVSLFKSIDMSDNVHIDESLNTDRTYGKLRLEKNIIVKPHRSRL